MYFITGIDRDEEKQEFETQTIGFFRSWRHCKETLGSVDDMAKMNFEYIVVEEVGTGLHPNASEIYWIKPGNKPQYIEKPDFLAPFKNFSIE